MHSFFVIGVSAPNRGRFLLPLYTSCVSCSPCTKLSIRLHGTDPAARYGLHCRKSWLATLSRSNSTTYCISPCISCSFSLSVRSFMTSVAQAPRQLLLAPMTIFLMILICFNVTTSCFTTGFTKKVFQFGARRNLLVFFLHVRG